MADPKILPKETMANKPTKNSPTTIHRRHKTGISLKEEEDTITNGRLSIRVGLIFI
jgi:hypothetical protein